MQQAIASAADFAVVAVDAADETGCQKLAAFLECADANLQWIHQQEVVSLL